MARAVPPPNSEPSGISDPAFAGRCRWLGMASISVSVLIGVSWLLLGVHQTWMHDAATRWQSFWIALVLALPVICYASALVAIGLMFLRIGRGQHFHQSIARGLGRSGLMLLLGGALSSAGATNAFRLLNAFGLAQIPLRPFEGLLHFDMAYICIAFLGCALILLGRVLREAAELAEREQRLRAELAEFV